jgi:hypothetical protein
VSRISENQTPDSRSTLPEDLYRRWEQERIDNIHDKQAIAERFGWKLVDHFTEMEIDRRNREIMEGTRSDFFNSNGEKEANRWLKALLSEANGESTIMRLLKKTP